ncbi:inhibitor of growth protein 3-like isoform X3 [Carassius auratus]|uniref:Inhibitor of growth protein 3-like isoform X3 n=1 Tax=Carassius auratus TaxID=7957 RepID=A0A6P6LAH4_CARAU|nr:inhibitor of growth protein 3-like isoform X3 [Carassius auratus]XP_052410891.1 inhibitor of growth protein 3 isoform X5 [Carassius gibelio]
MLYLEDYLEMIEQLPMDLRDRFTEMREMDLQVQNAMDQLEQRVNEFFTNAKKNKPEWREEQMEIIKKDYYKALEDADEKVQLANQIYDLVDRHLRKLDQELAKFKMELEADNAGITEVLERRSLEMDSPSQPVNNHHVHSHATVEKRKYSTPAHHTTEHVPEKKFKSEALLSTLTSDASKENTPGCRVNSTSSSNSVYNVNSSQSLSSYNLSPLPAGPAAGAGAISMAAAQTLAQGARPKATLSLPTTSPLHPPLPLHCHPARHRQHWLMSWFRPPSQKLTPAVRWTGPTTPMNPDTASATRCHTERWSAVITKIVQSSGSTTAVWV